MSGSNQHHLMQSIQRNFAVRREGKDVYVYAFERDREPELKLTDAVGAEPHFYAAPASDGSKTLDDRITQYERQRLARIINALRSAPGGAAVNQADAAELVDHMTLRSAHLRYSFTHAGQVIASNAIDLFGDEATIAGLLRVAGGVDGAFITQIIDRIMTLQPQLAEISLPRAVLEQIVRTLLDENKESVMEGMRATLAVLQGALPQLEEAARAGHNAGLAKALGRTPRAERLMTFEWRMERLDPDHLILPDCLALAQLSSSCDLQPLNLVDIDEVRTVLVPFGPHRLLVGRKTRDPMPTASELNHASALCSHAFFVSAVRTDELRELSRRIGDRNRGVIGSMIAEAIEELRLEIQVPERDDDPGSLAAVSCSRELTRGEPQYCVTFRDCADTANANLIARAVFAIVRELAQIEPLDRLDGITFAYDYAAALRYLDRGFAAQSVLVPRSDAIGTGVAMAVTVKRGDVFKRHVVIRGEFAWDLIGEDETLRSQATYTLIFEMMHVTYLQLLDEALPGIVLQGLPSRYEAILSAHVGGAPEAYFAARRSARLLPDQVHQLRELTLKSLTRACEAIAAQHDAFVRNRNFDTLLDVSFSELGDFVMFASQLFGHCDGLREEGDDAGVALVVALRGCGLERWAQRLHEELRRLWERRGKWRSYDEFLILNRLLERALWQFKIITWEGEGDMPIRVFVFGMHEPT